jgi:pyruvate kinase
MAENSNPSHATVGDRLTQVKTKIIATVGPACASFEMLNELVRAGVDVFRLNFAHGSHEWLEVVVGHIRKVSEETGRPISPDPRFGWANL